MFSLRTAFAVLLLIGLVAQAQGQRAQTPGQAPIQRGEGFGLEVTLAAKPAVIFSGTGRWDTAFETVVDAFRTVHGFLEKQDVKPAGETMMIYTAADDIGFSFQAAIPIEGTLPNPPQGDISLGTSPAGKAYKFVHRGSYDAMENMYEAITNFFEEKNIDAKDMFIEEYLTDPRSMPADQLIINVMVPVN